MKFYVAFTNEPDKVQRVNTLYKGISQLSQFYSDVDKMQSFKRLHPFYDMGEVIDSEQVLNYVPRWPIYVNLLAAAICMFLSVIYHNFNCMSAYWSNTLVTLDYGGITLVILGNAVPIIIYPFACTPLHPTRNFFISMVTVTCLSSFLALFNETLASTKCATFKALMFFSCGIMAGTPLIYLAFQNDTAYISYYSILEECRGGFFLTLGAVLYAIKFPE